MIQSVRILYLGVEGRCRMNYNWDAIRQESAVVITAAEWLYPVVDTHIEPSDDPDHLIKEGRPHLGAANVYVTNIGPHGKTSPTESEAGGVEFFLHVESRSPLDVMVTITVLDEVGIDDVVRVGRSPIVK